MPRTVDRMRGEDLDEVLAIERLSFSMPWSRGAFLYEMQQNRAARCWVMREDGSVVGYVCLWEIADELHITNIAVHPSHRGIGVEAAQAFCRLLFDELGYHRLELEVYGFNERALRHAERVGYVREGVRRKAYRRHDEWQDGVLYGLLREDLDADD